MITSSAPSAATVLANCAPGARPRPALAHVHSWYLAPETCAPPPSVKSWAQAQGCWRALLVQVGEAVRSQVWTHFASPADARAPLDSGPVWRSGPLCAGDATRRPVIHQPVRSGSPWQLAGTCKRMRKCVSDCTARYESNTSLSLASVGAKSDRYFALLLSSGLPDAKERSRGWLRRFLAF